MSLKRFYFPGFVFLGLLCFGLQAHQAHAAILLQGINTGHGAVTLSTSTNAGEFIVVEWAMSEGAFAVPTITDNLGDTYAEVFATTSRSGANGTGYGVWYLANAPAGIITVSSSITAYAAMAVAHYTGIATANPLDVYNATTSNQGTPWVSGEITTTQASELMIGGNFCWGNGGGGCVGANLPVLGASWADATTTPDQGDDSYMDFGQQIVSSVQTNMSSTGTGGDYNSPWIVTFEGANSPPPLLPNTG